MKRIYFDGRGRVWRHHFFWQPWGITGCLGRALLFMLLLFFFLLLLSLFRSCADNNDASGTGAAPPQSNVVPPVNDDDVIDDGARRIVSNRVNVLFKAEVGAEQIDDWKTRFHQLYDSTDYRIIFCDINTKLMSLQVPSEHRRQLITALPRQISDIPFIAFEEEVMEFGYQASDPALSDSTAWYVAAIDADPAWDRTVGNSDITVAIVDSYFDLSNPDLSGSSVIMPYSVANGNSDVSVPDSYSPASPDPVLCHGTMVATLALGAHNGHGTAGMAPRCSFMPISLGSRFGCLAILQGLLYAVNHGARVINLSVGMSLPDEVASWPVEQQIELAQTEFLEQENVWKYVFDMCDKYLVTIVWASGNSNVFTAIDASKRGDNTIKVSSVDRNNAKAGFSNFGNFEERSIFESTVSSPGVKVYGELPGGGNMAVDGTSFSAPIVAGTVGLIKSLDCTLTTVQIADILRQTGVQSDDRTIGPTIRTGAALDRVAEGFMTFDEFRNAMRTIMAGDSAGVNVTIPTTIVFHIADPDDPTVLPQLVQLFLCNNGTAQLTASYRSNYNPARPWTVPAVVEITDDKVTVSHVRSGAVNDISIEEFRFDVTADGYGCAQISMDSSNPFNINYKPYIKKPL